MLDKMTNQLNFHGNALVLRGERQRAIASNIANADTPGYVARDFKFGDALREATGVTSSATGTPGAAVTRLATSGSYGTAGTTDPHHIPLPTVNSSTRANIYNIISCHNCIVIMFNHNHSIPNVSEVS